MLGSRYNDRKERLENRRSSFFLTSAEANLHASARRLRSVGSTATPPDPTTVTDIRRQTIAKSRSLDSGVRMDSMSSGAIPFHANNPQDDYGSTRNQSSFSLQENEAPLLAGGAGRSKSMIGIQRSSCGDLAHIDEKPVSYSSHVSGPFLAG